MVWQKYTDKKKDGQQVFEYIMHHIDGVELEKGGRVLWGEEHPFGWDSLDQAINFLYDRFDLEGFTHDNQDRRSTVLQIKEKYGQLRVYIHVYEEDEDAYYSILKQALEKFPGLEDYLSPDFTHEKTIFTGTEKEYEEWLRD